MRSKQDIPAETGGLSAWAGLDKMMRDMDESKIKDYKEDMDALLVFVRAEIDIFSTYLRNRHRPVCILRY